MESRARKRLLALAAVAALILLFWFGGGHRQPAPGPVDRAMNPIDPVIETPAGPVLPCAGPGPVPAAAAAVAPATPLSAPSIGGIVMDAATGQPLAGAVVFAQGPEAPERARHHRKTEADGRFGFHGLQQGTFQVWVDPSAEMKVLDYHRVQIGDVASGTTDVHVRMARGRRISGTVRDDRGLPVAARIEVVAPRDGGSSALLVRTLADASPEGAFLVHGVPDGDYDLEIEPENEDCFVRGSLRGIPAGTEGVAIVLRRGAPIRGRVVAADGSDPGRLLGGAIYCVEEGEEVRLLQHGELRRRDYEAIRRHTAPESRYEDGTFRTRALPLGTRWDLVAEGFPGSVPVRARGIPAGATDVRIRLDPGGRIGGTVLGPEGRPVGAGVPVWAEVEGGITSDWRGRSATGATNVDGTFLLGGLGEFPFRLGAGGLGSDYAPRLGEETVTIGTMEAKLRVDACAVFTGRLVDGKGAPLAGCRIMTMSEGRGSPPFTREVKGVGLVVSPAESAMAETDSDGRFTLRGLRAGTFWLDAWKEGRGSRRFENLTAPASNALLTWEDR